MITRDIRRGFALPMALAAVLLLAAVAALASIAARAALRESLALAGETQAVQSRATLRARAARQLATVPRGQLLGASRPLGAGDTVLSVAALAWPWHRVSVSVAGIPVVAEFARGVMPGAPWCSAAIAGGVASVAAGSLSITPGPPCAMLMDAVPAAAITAFDDSLRTLLVLPVAPDTSVVTSTVGPVVMRARRRIDVAAGGTVSGILIAPVVCIGSGGTVRGLVLASDSLVVRAGASVIGDSAAVRNSLLMFSRLLPVGRAGLLLPP